MGYLSEYFHAYYSGRTTNEDTRMALTESTNLSLGAKAPMFTLPDTRSNTPICLADHAGRRVLIVFMCNHCPYVVHILDELVSLAHAAARDDLDTITISANDVTRYTQDAPAKMAELAAHKAFQFPYCFDETQTVARAYGALCTPDIFLFDTEHRLYYHGQFDNTRPGKGQATGADLRRAIQSLLQGQPAPVDTQPSVGCSIKWKP
jgi:peroxiredoxin